MNTEQNSFWWSIGMLLNLWRVVVFLRHHSLFFYLHRLATPFECTDGEFRDMSATAVPWCSSQFLSSSEEKKNISSKINRTVILFIQGLSLCVSDSLGKRHHSTSCGSKGRPNSTGWVARGVRCRPWRTWHQWTHPYGLRKVWAVFSHLNSVLLVSED